MEKPNKKSRTVHNFFFLSLKMKLTYIILMICLIKVQASVYSQRNKITLSVKDATIEAIFSKIESSTDFKFLYNSETLDINRKVSLKVKNEPINKVLLELFKGTNVTFSIYDKQIVLKPEKITTTGETGKKTLKAKKNQPTHYRSGGQDNIITGTVRDEYGFPLFGVTVLNINSRVGAVTDEDGNFSLRAKKDDVLEFSYLGFDIIQVVVDDTEKHYDITLSEYVRDLDEVTVFSYSTGYQEIDRERATGSFEHLDQKTLDLKTNQDILTELEGEVAGVVFDDGVGGYVIRGLSSIQTNTNIYPLVVVDGFPIVTGNSTTINPNDVEDHFLS